MRRASLNARTIGVIIAKDELRDRMGLECISVVMWRGRLRWFGHVERMGGGNWVKRVSSMNDEGASAIGRLKLTWNENTERPQGYEFK